MQEAKMVSKKKLIVDGQDVPGLINVDEISREKGAVEIPSFQSIVSRTDGTERVPPVMLTIRNDRDQEAHVLFEDWFKQNLVKDVIIVEYDGHSVEYGRYLLGRCECSRKTIQAFDAATGAASQFAVTILPESIDSIS